MAGFGTRMRPWTYALPKAMLSLADCSGRVRPILHWILAEAASGGIEQAAVVVSPNTRGIMQDYIYAARRTGSKDLPADVQFIEQENPRGLGDAVLRAADFVGDEPCIVYLGDHIYFLHSETLSCSTQVVEAYQSCGGSAMIGVQTVDDADLSLVGACRGESMGNGNFRCTDIVEKPTPAEAAEKLLSPALGKGMYFAHSGIYLFSPEIFDCLNELSRSKNEGELGLTDAQQLLLARNPDDYYLHLINGMACDAGTPDGYITCMVMAGNAAGHFSFPGGHS